MHIPDVVGLLLEDAHAELSKLHIHVEILETFSPKDREPVGECRIIKQIKKKDCIELTVSYF